MSTRQVKAFVGKTTLKLFEVVMCAYIPRIHSLFLPHYVQYQMMFRHRL